MYIPFLPTVTISIHSLRMEGDPNVLIFLFPRCYFNPLPPHGGRQSQVSQQQADIHISIHSLRMEGDLLQCLLFILFIHFNPLPPHGGRLNGTTIHYIHLIFQSTPSAWRETFCYLDLQMHLNISIHSLRMEGDLHRTSWKLLRRAFQSTPSAWRETVALYINDCPRLNFNPLPPHGGRPLILRTIYNLT